MSNKLKKQIRLFMPPHSPVFYTVETVRIFLQWKTQTVKKAQTYLVEMSAILTRYSMIITPLLIGAFHSMSTQFIGYSRCSLTYTILKFICTTLTVYG